MRDGAVGLASSSPRSWSHTSGRTQTSWLFRLTSNDGESGSMLVRRLMDQVGRCLGQRRCSPVRIASSSQGGRDGYSASCRTRSAAASVRASGPASSKRVARTCPERSRRGPRPRTVCDATGSVGPGTLTPLLRAAARWQHAITASVGARVRQSHRRARRRLRSLPWPSSRA